MLPLALLMAAKNQPMVRARSLAGLSARGLNRTVSRSRRFSARAWAHPLTSTPPEPTPTAHPPPAHQLIELKSGDTYNGNLIASDSFMNLSLKDVVCTSRAGDRFWKLPQVYVRGIAIKYIRVPEQVADLVPSDGGAAALAAAAARGRGNTRGGFRGGRGGGGGGDFRGGRGGGRGGAGGDFRGGRGGGGRGGAGGEGGGRGGRGGGGRGGGDSGGRGGGRGGGGGAGAK
jgi:U6 snRNA-associated Sm-like protein LSm4